MRVGVEHDVWLSILFEGLQDINGICIKFAYQIH